MEYHRVSQVTVNLKDRLISDEVYLVQNITALAIKFVLCWTVAQEVLELGGETKSARP